MKRICELIVVAAVIGLAACGGGSSSDDTATTYAVTATVETPTTASISSPFKSISKAVAEGVTVQAQDAAGSNIGSPCTTAADGTCSISLTAAELEAGVVFVASDMHSYREFDSADIALIASAPLTAPINATEDVVYAITAATCGGGLASCPATLDPGCLRDAVGALPGDDAANTSAVDGYIEGLVAAQGNALINGGANATGNLIAALRGDTAGFVANVGSDTVSGVPVADAVTNSTLTASTIQSAFCTRESAGAASPWETARLAAPTTDKATFGMAMAGMFEYFTPTELQGGAFKPEDFRGFMSAGPQLTDFFNMAGGTANDLARKTFVEGFRQGMFADAANAHVALGFVTATFPTPVAGVYNWTGNAFDPTTAALAGRNGFMDLTSSGSFNPATYTPNMIYASFQPMMGDPTFRSSFASGAGSDFVGAFMGNPTGFVPANYQNMIQQPPEGPCADSSNCLPCDTCTELKCKAGSGSMGQPCTSNSNCDEMTVCVGPPSTTFAAYAGKRCMCTSVVPTGLGVYTGADTAPQPYGTGTAGAYTPPASGTQGGQCGPGHDCGEGLICTDSTYGGVCVPSGFQFPAGHSCATNADCKSDNCSTSLVCVAGGSETIGTKLDGQPCAFPNECQSMVCMAGLCQPMGGGGGLKADGDACATGDECLSHYCHPTSLICMQSGGLPAGQPCTFSMACASMACNFATGLCF